MSNTPNAEIKVETLEKDIPSISENTIVFGCDNNNSNYATGWLYKAHIWYDDLGDAECRKIAAWPREQMNLLVKSIGSETT